MWNITYSTTYSNWITITGNQKEIEKFWEKNPELNFEKIIPIEDILKSQLNCDYGEGYEDEIVQRWGCSRIYSEEEDTISGHRDLTREGNNIYFETQVNNPKKFETQINNREKIVRELSKQYPTLRFHHEWIQRNIFLKRGKGEYNRGKCRVKNIDVALGIANLVKSDLKDLRKAQKMMKELYKSASPRTIQ